MGQAEGRGGAAGAKGEQQWASGKGRNLAPAEEAFHRARQPAAGAAVAGQALHLCADRTDIAGVLFLDVAEQPARQQFLQLPGDVLAGRVAPAVVGHPLDEEVVDALVGAAELVAGVLHQRLLEGEMRHRVVDQRLDHHPDRRPVLTLGFVQLVDHLDDAPVLRVDHLDAGVQIVAPGQISHFGTPHLERHGCRWRAG